jgi:hypothetical protein
MRSAAICLRLDIQLRLWRLLEARCNSAQAGYLVLVSAALGPKDHVSLAGGIATILHALNTSCCAPGLQPLAQRGNQGVVAHKLPRVLGLVLFYPEFAATANTPRLLG